MIQTWHTEIIISTVNKVFVRHRTYLHVHFDIKQTHKFLYLIWYLQQFYASRVIHPKIREISCYLLLNDLGCSICIVYDFTFLFKIKQISFPVWSRHFYTTKLKTLKTSNKYYLQLKEFTNYKTNTMVSTFNYPTVNCQSVYTRTSIYHNTFLWCHTIIRTVDYF